MAVKSGCWNKGI